MNGNMQQSPHGPRVIDTYSQLFDHKVAQQPDFHYHGLEGGMAWRVKVRNYLVGKCPDCEVLLDWAEAHDGKITWHEIDYIGQSLPAHARVEQDPRVIAGHVWTWLGLTVKGKAENVYNTGGPERVRNGLEAWRKLYAHIVNGTKLHNMTLRDKVYQPRETKNVAEVPAAIGDWENLYRDFRATGGSAMTPYEEKMTLCKLLPSAMRDNMLYRAMDETISYERFRDVCCHRVAELSYLGGHHRALVAYDEEQIEPPPELSADDEEAMAARMESRGWKVVPPSRKKQFMTGQASTRTTSSSTLCVNCGAKTHATRDCPRSRVDPADRPCWECGKKGHTRSKCPNLQKQRSGAPARQAAEEAEDEVNMMCGSCDDQSSGFSRARQPRQLKIADFLDKETAQKVMGEIVAEPIVQNCSNSVCMHETCMAHGRQVTSNVGSLEAFPPLSESTLTSKTKAWCNNRTGWSNNHNAQREMTAPAFARPGGREVLRATSSTVRPVPMNVGGVKRDVQQAPTVVNGDVQQVSTVVNGVKRVSATPPACVLAEGHEVVRAQLTSPACALAEGHEVTRAHAQLTSPACALAEGHEVTRAQMVARTGSPSREATEMTNTTTAHERPHQTLFGVAGAIGVPPDEELSETPIAEADLQRVFGPGDYRPKQPSTMMTPTATALVCAEEELDQPVFELNDDEYEELILTITADSGAGNHIASAQDLGETYRQLIEPSPASRAGKGFIAANDQKILNEGQVALRLQGEADGDVPVNSLFQVADVNRPLMSIGRICDQGHRVCFDSDKAEVINKKSGRVVMTFLRKNGGLYTADLVLKAPRRKSPDPAKSKDFGRHGRR